MITSDVLFRTIKIKFGSGTGTAFSLDIEEKQYLVTAEHVIKDLNESGVIEVWQDNLWKQLSVKRIGRLPSTVDVAVLAPGVQLCNMPAIVASIADIAISQDAYIVGFPFGLDMPTRKGLSDFPFPFVKKGVVSAFYLDPTNDPRFLIVDAYNNPGFSGGPIICLQNNDPLKPQVVGVISGYRFELKKLTNETGKEIELYYQSHANLTIAHSIRYALELIAENPIGIEIKR